VLSRHVRRRRGMTLPLYYYVLGTPLGVLASSAGLLVDPAGPGGALPADREQLPADDIHRVPVYQEDPAVFAAAIESWLRNRVHEVILVIDASDARCQEIASRYPVTVLITDVPGSGTRSARAGTRRSDRPGRARRLRHDLGQRRRGRGLQALCRRPRRRGRHAAERVRVKGFLARITDMFLDHRYFDEKRQPEPARRAVSCCRDAPRCTGGRC